MKKQDKQKKQWEPYHLIVANNIADLSKEKKVSVYKMADLLGVNTRTVSRYRSGLIPVSIDALFEISKILGVDIKDMF